MTTDTEKPKQALCDPDNIHLEIKCIECKKGLWEMKVLSRFGGAVGATHYRPMTDDVPRFSSSIDDCAFCGKKFYHINKRGEHLYYAKDIPTGQTVLI